MNTKTMNMIDIYSFWPKGPTASERKAIREAGWRIVDGVMNADGTGYFPACSNGGGYEDELVPARDVVRITAGAPGYHGEVAIKVA